jgi:hypothetical protein
MGATWASTQLRLLLPNQWIIYGPDVAFGAATQEAEGGMSHDLLYLGPFFGGVRIWLTRFASAAQSQSRTIVSHPDWLDAEKSASRCPSLSSLMSHVVGNIRFSLSL